MESPFEVMETVKTMKEIRLNLAKEELITSGEGVEVEREDTPSTFILMGLEIEESQWHLAIDVKAIANLTGLQEVKVLKRRTAIAKRIRAFRTLQRTYMPRVRQYLTPSQCTLWDSDEDQDAKAIWLFLPSDITDSKKREKACAEGLPAGVLRQNNVHIHKAKLRYCYVRNVLSRLRGNGDWERVLNVLQDSDVRALNERALTEEEAAQREVVHDLRDVEGGVGTYGVVALGEGRWSLSWIWYTTKVEDTEQELVEALCVEWCKVYAQMQRWYEDVVLVEEMRRTIQYGYWEAGEWLQRSVARDGMSDGELQEGIKAYGLEQAHWEAETCTRLKAKWTPWRERGQQYLARESVPIKAFVAPIEERCAGDEDADDEDESLPDYEDEDEDTVE
ncbi:hypothetical protein B0H16DRAFT_1886706 [Mycena metata]|uniref:Uncharacterized protein n=2 Tax=Mycena metata TaxID=1033252 RepID=A0AAD7NC78_9AGAR|nr:hypothetical protein B0H16DRAFT_1886706 [Mycena metata]